MGKEAGVGGRQVPIVRASNRGKIEICMIK